MLIHYVLFSGVGGSPRIYYHKLRYKTLINPTAIRSIIQIKSNKEYLLIRHNKTVKLKKCQVKNK